MPRHRLAPEPAEPHQAVHPAVRQLWLMLVKRRLSLCEVSRRSGVDKSTISRWFNPGMRPKVPDLDAALNVFGLELSAVPLTVSKIADSLHAAKSPILNKSRISTK